MDFDNAEYVVTYLDPDDGSEAEINVSGVDANDAEEAAREELSAEYPSIDTDEWEIVSVTLMKPLDLSM